jgi:hypothetical protein
MRNGNGRDTGRVVIVLDTKHWQEIRFHDELGHDAGRLLKFLLRRMSLARGSWSHTYVYKGSKDDLPGKKKERLTFLTDHLTQVNEHINHHLPCVIVGMGKLACEYLTGHSKLIDRAGTCWRTGLYGDVWITYSPDAALFDPVLCVSLYGVLFKAAESAGIEPKFDPSVPMFDWTPYLKGARQ